MNARPLAPALVALAALGCHSDPTPSHAEASSGGELSGSTASVAVSVVAETIGDADAEIPHAAVVLALRDDAGNVSQVSLGEFVGQCATTEASAPDLITHQCWWAGAGTRFHVRVVEPHALVVLQEELDESIPEGADAGREVRRITLPASAAVEVAP